MLFHRNFVSFDVKLVPMNEQVREELDKKLPPRRTRVANDPPSEATMKELWGQELARLQAKTAATSARAARHGTEDPTRDKSHMPEWFTSMQTEDQVEMREIAIEVLNDDDAEAPTLAKQLSRQIHMDMNQARELINGLRDEIAEETRDPHETAYNGASYFKAAIPSTGELRAQLSKANPSKAAGVD